MKSPKHVSVKTTDTIDNVESNNSKELGTVLSKRTKFRGEFLEIPGNEEQKFKRHSRKKGRIIIN